jgi:hypothetical protein
MAPAFPKTNRERGALYANAMHEVRMRLRMIEQLGNAPMVPLFLYESCHLQLRLSCECLAVACLAAQGDFQTHKAFRERYEPPLIFKALESLYPDFFPIPSSLSKSANGWHLETRAGSAKAIARAKVERIWNQSGSHLHRGSAKRYIARTNAVDRSEIQAATEAFWALILDHIIVLSPAIGKATATILHVLMERDGDEMRVNFLHVDSEAKTIELEEMRVLADDSDGAS